MARFRMMSPLYQSAVVGILFFLLYGLYATFILSLPYLEALQISLYSAVLFIVIYYFTSTIIMKKRSEAEIVKGPKKGKRKS
ncbi:MAG: hypothetical protein MUO26_07045 [Methanotrichaceae archaeon]|nr:hypothetical protein [Methanotrichaceae archaeon]